MLVLYGRAHCRLCDVMAERLLDLDLPFEKVDVDGDPALVARYGTRVPVLADAQGVEVCHAHLDVAALRTRLALE
jgi:hypothetical protein